MQAQLILEPNEVNHELIKTLLDKNIDILIKKKVIVLEAYDTEISVDKVMEEFSKQDYSAEFLAELEQGLQTSSAYAK